MIHAENQVELIQARPIAFEANEGQTDGRIQFIAHGMGYELVLMNGEALLTFRKAQRKSQMDAVGVTSASQESACAGLHFRLVGANRAAEGEPLDPLSGKVNYIQANDRSKWRLNVATYARVKFNDVYPGIALAYYGNQKNLEFDFIVAPGADPNSIRFEFEAADAVSLDANGDLLLNIAGEQIRQHKPFIYQEVEGNRRKISGGYQMTGTRQVGFQVGEYDPAKSLVIDPTLSVSIYLGGTALDNGLGIAVDSENSIYVTGSTLSTDFRFLNACQAVNLFPTRGVGFVTKFDRSGSMIFSTYLGGDGITACNAVAVNLTGLYVCGFTEATDYTNTTSLCPLAHPCRRSFVTKFKRDKCEVVYSTLFGGDSCTEEAHSVAVDGKGFAYVAGQTDSSNFCTGTLNGFQTKFGGDNSGTGNGDGYVVKLNTSGTALLYATYFGGSSRDVCRGIAVDIFQNAYVTGDTMSTDLPRKRPIQRRLGGARGAFVAKIDTTRSGQASLVYSTYLSGNRTDVGVGIAVDIDRNVYVAGHTTSGDLATPNVLQSCNKCMALFVAKINTRGSARVYCTYLGAPNGNPDCNCLSDVGVDETAGNPIAVDGFGNVYVTGFAGQGLPTVCAILPGNVDDRDAFVAKLNPRGTALIYSTYLGGHGNDSGMGIAIDSLLNAYVVGSTSSPDFPMGHVVGSEQPGEGGDAFVAKIISASIRCPPDIVTVTDSGKCFATKVNVGSAGAADNCTALLTNGKRSDNPNLPLNAPYSKGTTVITWRATDLAGRTHTCLQKIEVQDKEPPKIQCPSMVQIKLSAGQTFATLDPGTATATDNCSIPRIEHHRSDGPDLPLNAPYPIHTTVIIWTATDDSGNTDTCTQQVVVLPPDCKSSTLSSQDPGNAPGNGRKEFIIGSISNEAVLQLIAQAKSDAEADARNKAMSAGNGFRCDAGFSSKLIGGVNIGSPTVTETPFQAPPPVNKPSILISAKCPWTVTVECYKP